MVAWLLGCSVDEAVAACLALLDLGFHLRTARNAVVAHPRSFDERLDYCAKHSAK